MFMVKSLEVECMALEPKLQEAQAKYDLLNALSDTESDGIMWEGEDEALKEKEEAEQRHHDLLLELRQKKDALRDELSKYAV